MEVHAFILVELFFNSFLILLTICMNLCSFFEDVMKIDVRDMEERSLSLTNICHCFSTIFRSFITLASFVVLILFASKLPFIHSPYLTNCTIH